MRANSGVSGKFLENRDFSARDEPDIGYTPHNK